MSDSSVAARAATLVALPIALIVGIVTFWLMGGFGNHEAAKPRPQSTAPVAMPAPPLDDQHATACRALLSHLPGALRDRPRRPVTAGAEQNAAYGDPAITMACAVPPITVPQGEDVFVLSGVCWYSQTSGSGSVWTTVDRDVPVRVTVPGSYHSPGQWVIEFSAPITSALPRAANVPAGCQ
jgi:Protein of unknown function (DUF3515)